MKKEGKVKTVAGKGSSVTEVSVPNEVAESEIGTERNKSLPSLHRNEYNRPGYIRKLKKGSENYRY